MVLKVINKSDKDICLPWGQWNYKIPAGGELINPPTAVITDMLERYANRVELVKQEPVKEVVAEPVIEETKEAPVRKTVSRLRRFAKQGE